MANSTTSAAITENLIPKTKDICSVFGFRSWFDKVTIHVRPSLLLVSLALLSLGWAILQVYAAQSLAAQKTEQLKTEQQAIASFQSAMQKMPPYKLTFVGAKFLRAGDIEFAKAALKEATKKDRFYRDAFKYYGYALQAAGDNDGAELALRRAKTLDPRQ